MTQRLTEACAASDRELADAIRALRAERARPQELDALARRLGPRLATPDAIRTPAPPLAGLSKWLVSLVLAFGTGFIAMLQLGRPEPEVKPLPRTAAPTPAVIVSPAVPVEPRLEPAVTDPSPDLPSVAAATPAPARRPAGARSARVKPLEVAASSPAKPFVAASPQPSAAADSPNEVEAELALLGRAQRELGADPRAALALAEEHAATYPRGLFVQEREMLAIQALLKLKQRNGALARARAFVTNHPTSPHARHLHPLLGRE